MDDHPLILGIETSCDETAAAVVRGGREVLSSVVASQDDLHVAYAGVVPEIASRAHVERISPVVREAVRRANVVLSDLDAVAVGNRPGLIGSLLVGVSAAKAIAWSIGRPLIGVDHVIAHLHAAALNDQPIEFPAMGLVVSGGHTSLYLIEDAICLRRLGRTIDDAAGEAFDKAATILGLPYPGGPHIDTLAQRGDDRAHAFPVSAPGDGLDFSFSGLKTAVLYAVRGRPDVRNPTAAQRDASTLSEREIADFAASFQRAAVKALMNRLEQALKAHPGVRSLVLGGGVSANSRLRDQARELARRTGIRLRLPPVEFCVDNAAMIAGLAAAHFEGGRFDPLSLAARTLSNAGEETRIIQ